MKNQINQCGNCGNAILVGERYVSIVKSLEHAENHSVVQVDEATEIIALCEHCSDKINNDTIINVIVNPGNYHPKPIKTLTSEMEMDILGRAARLAIQHTDDLTLEQVLDLQLGEMKRYCLKYGIRDDYEYDGMFDLIGDSLDHLVMGYRSLSLEKS